MKIYHYPFRNIVLTLIFMNIAGCSVFAVADAAVSITADVVSTGVSVAATGVKAASSAVRAVIPDSK
jgi:hypothetical protein